MLTSLVMWIFIRQITGAPLPNSSCTPSTIPLPLSTLVDAAGCALLDQRSIWDIVWGCIVTIFSCTWIAIHPNIPDPDDSRWCVFKRGLITMICAIIAPELIMAWALRQHIGARQIMHDYNKNILKIESSRMPFYRRFTKYIKQFFFREEECDGSKDVKWTKTHGFFIQMGGFMLYNDGVPVQVLTYRCLKTLSRQGQVDIPRITERTINDKSKSDYLSKGFVIVQTTWFVVQCATRQAKSLPLAELEVFTLAFAVLNAITYAIWFDKPQNVQEGIRVDLKLLSPEPLIIEQPQSKQSWLHLHLLKDYRRFRGTRSGLLWFITYRIPYRAVGSAYGPIYKLMNYVENQPGYLRVPMFGSESFGYVSLVLKLHLPCLIGVRFIMTSHIISYFDAIKAQYTIMDSAYY